MSELTITYSRGTYYIERGEDFLQLEFFFQRILDLQNSRASYCEVFTRMLYQSGEDFQYEDFFDGVSNEFIKTIALLQLKFVRRKKLAIQPAINITLSCLEDDDFVVKLLDFKRLRFILEVTVEERDLDSFKLAKNIKQLKNAGIKIWLDDYQPEDKSSSATLGEIVWDRIKVERSVVQKLSLKKDVLSSFLFVLAPFTTQGLVLDGIDSRLTAGSILSLNVLAQGSYYSELQNWKSLQKSKLGVVNEPVQDASHTFISNINEHSQRVA